MSPNESQPQPAHTNLSRIIVLTAATTLTLTGVIAIAVLILTRHNAPPTVNPFSSQRPSEAFPLYYSTKPPSGYVADLKSVSQPHDGVVLYNLIKGHDKIVVTEEARTSKLVNLGAFYQQLRDSKQVVVSDGAIATGYFGDTKVASRANNKTWILVTATSDVSLDQLRDMLQNITTVQ